MDLEEKDNRRTPLDELVEQCNGIIRSRDKAKQCLREFILRSQVFNLLPVFVNSGYDDLDFILELSEIEFEDMLNTLGDEANKLEIPLKAGHKVRVKKLFDEERLRRGAKTNLRIFEGREIYTIIKMFHLMDMDKSGFC